ncbi:MAG: hypothetical protein ENTB_03234 [Enterocloster aldenensis]
MILRCMKIVWALTRNILNSAQNVTKNFICWISGSDNKVIKLGKVNSLS